MIYPSGTLSDREREAETGRRWHSSGGSVPNSVVLMFVRGWQGGTVHQIAKELDTTADDIESADLRRMGELMRVAQMKLAAQGRAEAMGHGLTAPMPRELSHPNHGGTKQRQG